MSKRVQNLVKWFKGLMKTNVEWNSSSQHTNIHIWSIIISFLMLNIEFNMSTNIPTNSYSLYDCSRSSPFSSLHGSAHKRSLQVLKVTTKKCGCIVQRSFRGWCDFASPFWFRIILKEDIAKVKNPCHNSIDGHLFRIWDPHQSHSFIGDLEVTNVIQLDVCQTALWLKLSQKKYAQLSLKNF